LILIIITKHLSGHAKKTVLGFKFELIFIIIASTNYCFGKFV